MVVREVDTEEADRFKSLIESVEGHSQYMLMEEGERQTTVEGHRKQIERMKNQENSTILVVEENGNLIGYVIIFGGTTKRTNHAGYLVVGLRKEYRGKGIGTSLFQKIDEWAFQVGLIRIELTVATVNTAAISLYKKSGFVIEGTRSGSLCIDGILHDEYYMAKRFK
ncbi:GNAT family N-acetyltransferase [Pontibacillus salipaludis]|uniref:GCN5 family N-acetyltransferase n=1 Tax=Pontibacillus salipaludis TaxID=1697394 RepID=A0ABQ1QAY9_9BACI|nr:GNAT family N-acetyltransferase [Pontibacillus salipaludis]GGD21571.1 GCN5 family N-acetyltransferase [Pontibacillus salipaludis]